jgi:hypothetical protein
MRRQLSSGVVFFTKSDPAGEFTRRDGNSLNSC